MSEWISTQPDDVKGQRAALYYYGRYFAPENIDKITQDGFKDFLLLKNNRHWAAIHRQPNIYADMDRLRECLRILLDESTPIQERLDRIIPPNGPSMLRGLGKAVLTPILMCVYPAKYAVYNSVSEEALTLLDRNRIVRTDSFGNRYLALNKACHEISQEIGQPLTLVDAMFSLMVHAEDSPLRNIRTIVPIIEPPVPPNPVDLEPTDNGVQFSMEKHLQDFLVANWDKTQLGKSYLLHTEDEDSATEYPTAVGRIDILARDKATDDWVVIELKKGRDSDKVLGQLLRYMGWVKRHKAGPTENVRGIIITSEKDDRLLYAMVMSPNVSFYTYRVSFDLREESSK